MPPDRQGASLLCLIRLDSSVCRGIAHPCDAPSSVGGRQVYSPAHVGRGPGVQERRAVPQASTLTQNIAKSSLGVLGMYARRSAGKHPRIYHPVHRTRTYGQGFP